MGPFWRKRIKEHLEGGCGNDLLPPVLRKTFKRYLFSRFWFICLDFKRPNWPHYSCRSFLIHKGKFDRIESTVLSISSISSTVRANVLNASHISSHLSDVSEIFSSVLAPPHPATQGPLHYVSLNVLKCA